MYKFEIDILNDIANNKSLFLTESELSVYTQVLISNEFREELAEKNMALSSYRIKKHLVECMNYK